jgi:hypothetical protein
MFGVRIRVWQRRATIQDPTALYSIFDRRRLVFSLIGEP